ncbi:MAG: hypothetical protein J0I07_32170 [Myxococcales bacterium]|nr:hypothetical protein [Myxococcales bacterium]
MLKLGVDRTVGADEWNDGGGAPKLGGRATDCGPCATGGGWNDGDTLPARFGDGLVDAMPREPPGTTATNAGDAGPRVLGPEKLGAFSTVGAKRM